MNLIVCIILVQSETGRWNRVWFNPGFPRSIPPIRSNTDRTTRGWLATIRIQWQSRNGFNTHFSCYCVFWQWYNIISEYFHDHDKTNLIDRLEREIGEIFAMPEGEIPGVIQWQPFDTCFYLAFQQRDILEIQKRSSTDKPRYRLTVGDRVEFYHARERNKDMENKIAKFIIPARLRRYQVRIVYRWVRRLCIFSIG